MPLHNVAAKIESEKINRAARSINKKEGRVMNENKNPQTEADVNTNEIKNEALEDVAGGLIIPPLSNCSICGSRVANNHCPKGCKR